MGRLPGPTLASSAAVWLRLLLAVVAGCLLLTSCRTGVPGQTAPPSPVAPASGAAATSSPTPRAQGTAGESRVDVPDRVDPETGLVWIDQQDLPTEARQTIGLIDKGGPFPYRKDGAVFGNFEGLLPDRPRGYYHEYTVRTPGERDRGARRIVTGDGTSQLFWTDDHYDSFSRVRR